MIKKLIIKFLIKVASLRKRCELKTIKFFCNYKYYKRPHSTGWRMNERNNGNTHASRRSSNMKIWEMISFNIVAKGGRVETLCLSVLLHFDLGERKCVLPVKKVLHNNSMFVCAALC